MTHDHAPHANDSPTPSGCCAEHAAKSHIDPVCGMQVAANPEKSAIFNGKTYYFCCQRCVSRFTADPGQFLQKTNEKNVQSPVASQALYTCPMHPEIEQIGPGICPKCGMALEPLDVTVDADDGELSNMTRRFWISLAFTLPLLMISMGEMLPGVPMLHRLIGMSAFNYLQALLATPVVLWGGWPIVARAWASFRSWHLNMFSLIGLGVAASFLFSLFALLAPDVLPDAFKANGMAPLYFESAAVIVCLVLMGQVLELRARARTNTAIKSLLQLAPATALRVKADGSEEEVLLADLKVGDLIRVKPGGKIPVDGIVQEGESHVDESMISGEPLAVAKQSKDGVSAGTVNQAGALLLRAEKVGRDTLLAQIVQTVNEASRSRVPIQNLADRVSAWFVPAVIAGSTVAFIAWAAFGPAPALANGLVAAISVLIIACPCALGLATPISIMLGIGRGATEGILIKDASALQTMEKVDVLAIDKTGTLTEGKPEVQRIVTAPGFTEVDVLRVAASLEALSEHPLAYAIINRAASQQVRTVPIANFRSITGRGLSGDIENVSVALGNIGLMQIHNIDVTGVKANIDEMHADAQSIIYVQIGGRVAGLIGVADPIKMSSVQAIRQLQGSGVKIVMLTGDSAATAAAVARQTGIAEFQAAMLPQDKLAYLKRMQQQGHVVAMAGDGINDAPALAQANVGIAMGRGTDIAIQSAHIVLIKGDLKGIVKARQLSQATMKNIRQNLTLAFVYNFLGVPLAAGVLYPWLGILLSPMIASAAMSLSSVSVISNALRLHSAKFNQD